MDFLNSNSLITPINSGSCSIDDVPSVFAHIRMLHVNARDIRAGDKFAEIGDFVTLTGADVVCVSETFLSVRDTEGYNLDNFSHLSIVREGRGGGGVSVYVSNSFDILETSHFSSYDEGVQIIRCKVKRRDICCYVIAFYSNNRAQHDCLLEVLDRAISGLAFPVIALGDSNINTLRQDLISTEYLSFFSSNALAPAIEGITRFESGTCLDHIFLSVGHVADSYSRIIETNTISDHFPVWVAVCFKVEHAIPLPDTSQWIERRIFSTNNFSRFFYSLTHADFSTITQSNCVDTALADLENILFSVYNSSFPLKAFRLPIPSYNPLFPDPLRQLRRRLDRLRRKYCRNKANLLAKHHYYATLGHYRSMRKQVFAKLLNDSISRKDSARAWRSMKNMLGQRSSRGAPAELLVNGMPVIGPKLVAEAFAAHFAGVGEAVVSRLESSTTTAASLLAHRPLYLPFKIDNISELTLLSASKHIRTNFGGPADKIPSRILKQTLPFISKALLHIFNLSVNTGIFPERFKTATVIPLYKGKGSRADPLNYRPISLCSYFSKLFEKCISMQLSHYLNSVDYFSKAQFGFLRYRSTDLAICEFYNKIAHLVRGGNAALCAFLDVAKAFDSVSPDTLDNIFEALSFDILARRWFFSYLSFRKITVRVCNLDSDERKVMFGVPQGSSLGPLLFIIYINLILRYIESRPTLGACCYADDLTVFMKVNKITADADVRDFEAELVLLRNVYNAMGLSLNVLKTEIVLFKNTHSRIDLIGKRVQFGEISIPLSDSATFLGVRFSAGLNWLEHFHIVTRKCYGIIATLSRLQRAGLSACSLVYFYKALYIPVLCYGIPLWGTAVESHLRLMAIVQRDAIRALFGLPRRSSVHQHFLQYKLMNLKQLYRYRVSCLMFRQMSVGNSHYSRQYIHRPPLQYPIRNYDIKDLVISMSQTEYCNRAPLYQHGRVWNEIPANIRNATSIGAFQSMLRELLLDAPTET